MFASRTDLTTANVREWMGDFHEIRNVAKYATRLSQSFGSLRETVSISRQEVENIPQTQKQPNARSTKKPKNSKWNPNLNQPTNPRIFSLEIDQYSEEGKKGRGKESDWAAWAMKLL